MQAVSLRRVALTLFLVALGVSVLLAIVVVLDGDFGPSKTRVLATTATVTAGSVLALACAAFRERQRVAGEVGIALAALASAATITIVWGSFRSELFAKCTFVLAVAATAVAHAQLMLLPRLGPNFQWVQRTLVGLIAVLAATVALMIISEAYSPGVWRFVAVLSILVAGMTVAVPVLARIDRAVDAPASASTMAAAAAAAPTARLVLEQQADGTWVDAAGNRYEVRRAGPGRE